MQIEENGPVINGMSKRISEDTYIAAVDINKKNIVSLEVTSEEVHMMDGSK